MSDPIPRRSFLASAAAAGFAVPRSAQGESPGSRTATSPSEAARSPLGPVAVSSGNGLRATARAMELLRGGADTLDAAVEGVAIVEEDPEDNTVGYGGLPNEEGVVELDCCVMHGPSWNAGAVAALRGIKTPSRVAKLVMERTDHILLVGEGALRFALAHGFREEQLLTEKSREAWLRWRADRSAEDDWLSPEETLKKLEGRPTGTITCLVRNARGDLSGVTSTSGLAFKLPGRVGDSPLIGAGLYVDNDVGAAGATGRGEAIIIAGGSRIVVENMRRGLTPEEAVRDVLERIVKQTTEPRLKDAKGRPRFNVTLYALRKDGRYAAGSLWSGSRFAVHDGTDNTLRDCFYLFQRDS